MHKTVISSKHLIPLQQSGQSLVIFDCRFNLMDSHAGQAAYVAAHIPGAYYLHLDHDLSSPITPASGRHPLPDPQQLAATLAQYGVNADTQVVVYDDAAGAYAGRAWWLLHWLGHQAVAVLDGGWQSWLQQGGRVEAVLPTLPKAQSSFSPCLQPERVITTPALTHPHLWQLVDARSQERFQGKAEPIDSVAGHIPAAWNRPLTENLKDGHFKPPAQLRTEWLQFLEGTPPEQVVHSCGSGVSACHNLLAMEIAGLVGSRLYAGSWSEWIRDPQRGVAVGE